ncbi:MAG: hypothetical protein KJ630_16900 [Proteobacteria bacterium]|nr:hypothetical protein [Pseudomonadota bacterium]
MAKNRCPSTVTADIKRNRLIIRLRGEVPKKDVEQIYTDVRFCVADLKPGFSVITDLTEARIGHLSAIGTFKKITAYLTEKQVGQVIRVVGQGKVIFQQLAKLTDKTAGYQPMYAKNIEEAEVLLADLTGEKPES